jgi:hypothetical protein
MSDKSDRVEVPSVAFCKCGWHREIGSDRCIYCQSLTDPPRVPQSAAEVVE